MARQDAPMAPAGLQTAAALAEYLDLDHAPPGDATAVLVRAIERGCLQMMGGSLEL
jgi:hypothetical protein